MYTIKFSTFGYLYYPGDSKYCIYDSVLTQKIGEVGSLEFTIPISNIQYTNIKIMQTVWLYKDDNIIFEGYISEIENDMYKNLRIVCLETYNLLKNYVKKYNHNPVTYTSKQQAFTSMLDDYNSSAGIYLDFTAGQIMDDEDDAYEFVWSSFENLYEKLDEFRGQNCYFRMRYSDKRYLDVITVDAFGTSTQKIQLGINLLDYVETIDTSEMCNSISGYAVSELGGKLIVEVEDESSILEYGRFDKSFIYEGLTRLKLAKEIALKYVRAHKRPNYILKITALDLSQLDVNAGTINLGDSIHVIAEPYGIDADYRVSELVTYLQEPERNTYTIAGNLARQKTLTELMKG